jgi:hypothetical protein
MQEYMDHRACLLMLGKVTPGDLPLADNRWTQGQQVCTGTQTSLARLPDQPAVRDWLLKTVTNKKIQGAGRSRAARQARSVTVWQVGGYPPAGLADHGIRPIYERLQDGLSGAEVAAIHAEQRMRLLDDAAAHVVALGEKITRANMRDSVATLCNPMIPLGSSGDNSVRDRYIYIYQPRTENEAQALNENNDLEQPFFKNDGVWNGEYAMWREQAPDCVKERFAYGNDHKQQENAFMETTETTETTALPAVSAPHLDARGWEIEPHVAGFEPADMLQPPQAAVGEWDWEII